MKPAICLLSGGLDSATSLAVARRDGFHCYALSFDYGQRHRAELEAAARVAESLGAVRHLVVPIDLRLFGGSALTADIDVPKTGLSAGIPITYVPARNTVFLSLALAWAEVLEAPTFSSALTPSITPDIPIAGLSSSRPSSAWPTWLPNRVWKDEPRFTSTRL